MSTSTEQILPVIVEDPRISCHDSILFAVNKSGAQISQIQFTTTSVSPQQINWNLTVPSLNTILARSIKISVGVKAIFTANSNGNNDPTTASPPPYKKDPGVPTIVWGEDTAIQPYPLQNMASTTQLIINNNSISTYSSDIIPVLSTMNSSAVSQRWAGMGAPVQRDTMGEYLNYATTGFFNNPLSSINSWTLDNAFHGRGSIAIQLLNNLGFNNATKYNIPVVVDTLAGNTMYLQFQSNENLFLSPFFSQLVGGNKQGMYGIATMSLIMNTIQQNRLVRSAYVSACAIESFQSPTLQLTYLVPHPSKLLPISNCVPFSSYTRYTTPITSSIEPEAIATLTSSVLQLNSIPDQIWVYVKKNTPAMLPCDADAFLPIVQSPPLTTTSANVMGGISIIFNNTNGILSSASRDQLLEMSLMAGSNLAWEEGCGCAWTVTNTQTSTTIPYANTVGTCLCLEFGSGIYLPDDYSASGVLGAYQLTINLNVWNNTGYTIPANAYNIYILAGNSGVWQTTRGSCASFLSVLSKTDVVNASRSDMHVNSDEVKRFVGGGFFDSAKGMLGNAVGALFRNAPTIAKNVLKTGVAGPTGVAASKGLEMLGAGNLDGEGSSGGKKPKSLMSRIY